MSSRTGSRLSIPIHRVYWLLIAVSCLVGWFVPAFYDWTGSDQSRPSPLIWQTAVVLIVGTVIIWGLLPWVPLTDRGRDTDLPVRVRFTSRTMFLITAMIAFVIAATTKFPLFVSGTCCALAFIYVIWLLYWHPHDRWPTLALVACMCLPFIWVVAYDELNDIFPAILSLAAALPGFFAAAIIGSLVGQNLHDLMWVAVLITATELLVGTWLIRLGPRLTIAYLLFVMLMSTFGSFGLNALVRA